MRLPINSLLFLLLPLIASAEQSPLRRFPYPFSHLVTFASDVDMQSPQNGAALHRLINEDIGLPISDSLWVSGTNVNASSLFVGASTLNRQSSGVRHHAVFGLLLRQWHRGNIDHFHSWQDDAAPPLSEEFAQALRLSSAVTTINLSSPPSALSGVNYYNLRIYFNSPPPPDLSLRVYDQTGLIATASVALLKAGMKVKATTDQPPFIVEVMTDVPADVGLPQDRTSLDLLKVVRLELNAPSCKSGCTAAVTKVERDSFSRQTVLLQLPFLEAMNFRPVLLTSHGGWSGAQNFGNPEFSQIAPRLPGSNYESPLVLNKVRMLGHNRSEHAFHTDVLHRLGISSTWSMGGDLYHWNEPVPPLKASYEGMYDLQRTYIGPLDTTSLENFRRDIRAREPLLNNVDLDDIYCRSICGDAAQGAVLGLLIATSLAQIRAGQTVDHLWVTHFSSGDSDFNRTQDEPLKPSAAKWLRDLAGYYYNFSGHIAEAHRAWVSPAGTIARYRAVHAQIGNHISVDPVSSRVRIKSWEDPITRRIVPDLAAGMRDLHGITLYVPDSSKASLEIGKTSYFSFTRNPADGSGRQSITIVDDSAPEMLIDELPLSANGIVETAGGTWREPNNPSKGASYGQSHGTLTANNIEATVRWKPFQLNLRNITHLSLAYRKTAQRGAPRGKFSMEIEMDNGDVIVASEEINVPDAPNRSRWHLPSREYAGIWTRTVLSTADLRWPEGKLPVGRQRPALPLGQVREIRLRLAGATRGERLDVNRVAALRPNSNNVDPSGSKLIGGQVIGADGKPAPSVVVRADIPEGKKISTVTDRDGYYYFFRQPIGRVMKIAASKNGSHCAPLRGRSLQVRKDEAEVDIALDQCR